MRWKNPLAPFCMHTFCIVPSLESIVVVIFVWIFFFGKNREKKNSKGKEIMDFPFSFHVLVGKYINIERTVYFSRDTKSCNLFPTKWFNHQFTITGSFHLCLFWGSIQFPSIWINKKKIKLSYQSYGFSFKLKCPPLDQTQILNRKKKWKWRKKLHIYINNSINT